MTNHYDRCLACRHVFKPKRLTKLQADNRQYCLCHCHWEKNKRGYGITPDQALDLVIN